MSDVENNFSNQLVLIKEETDVLKGIIVDYKNGKILSTTTLDCKKFLDKDIPYVFFRRVKAVFLYIPELIPPDFSSNYEFRKTLKSKFDAAKISYYFFNEFQWDFTNMLISVEFCAPKIDDILLLIEIYDNEFVGFIAYQFTERGYIHSRKHFIKIDDTESDEYYYWQILNGIDPEALFIHGNSLIMMDRLKRIFGSKKVFTFGEKWNFDESKFLLEHSKWLFDKSYIQYHVRPSNFEIVCLNAKFGDSKHAFISFDEHFVLPLSKTLIVKKIVNYCNISIEQKDGGTPKILDSWLPEQNCHQHEITLSIDLNGFIDFSTKAIVWSNVKTLPKLLTENDFKVPVIAFSENLSFICVYKNGKYEYLNSWNGKFGMDLYISFDEEKPKYCQKALEAVRTKPTFVVHNIFEIMPKSPENVPECAFHDFKITKDEENPVLLEFDNFDGTRKHASPEFLMALLLRQHLKAIKKEIGKKSKKIAFATFDELSDEEWNRVNMKLTEACEMVKTECEFFDLRKLRKL
uniref:Uncharacterized protein n=1 Tax=Panagrolaimus davidi TaxID=227884 RepID=A0A914QWU8_9BILA